MLLPIGHDDLRGRRWPWVTIVIVALNALVFLGTHWRMDEENAQVAQVKIDTLILAAAQPDVTLSESQKHFVDAFKKDHPDDFEKLKSVRDSEVGSLIAAESKLEPEAAQEKANELGQKLEQLENTSIMERYAYFPYKHTAVSFITSMFLHAGWLHLIGNMWFLWLAGTVLEDAWGRGIYSVFYIISGIAATLIYSAASNNSFIGSIGASGAIAGVMGAFLIRFPKTKIKFFLYAFFMRFRFKAPAYAMLPLWLADQFIGAFVPSGPVAYWAHIGGFIFGACVALCLKKSGVEAIVDQKIESKVSSGDPRLEKASTAIDEGRMDQAVADLNSLLSEKPDVLEAHQLLLMAYSRQQNREKACGEAVALCKLNLKAREMDLAWQNYEEFCNMGGEKFPSTEWMALCRNLESQQQWQRAAGEYEKIAKAYTGERTSVYALVSAGRIQLKNLNNTAEAARLYQEAHDSPAPHLDWDGAIRKGLAECGVDAPMPVGRI
ncbi:MAG TPA: rhomboid family intramembrane serine protease [Candidatus Acidoferrales bacterium]|nr:rhomboid family intramembrane serine protease [Candidatus Acidoferrales bacterium]